MKTVLGVISLLISTGLLLSGHGMQLTLLPMRGDSLGISEFVIGLSASCYFLGFVAGCLLIPRIVGRVGHIRAFAVLTAVMISAVLALDLISWWPAWFALRFMTGLGMCGLYTVIESWLNSHAEPGSRGKILAIYTIVSLSGMTAGQFLINVGPVEGSVPFTVAALCLALAIIPIGLTRRIAPEPVEATTTGFRLLYSRSRSAFAGALLSGLVAGSFWALGAVFAQRYSAKQFDVTLFMSIAIAGGALIQYPVGWLSDRIDRRRVLVILAGIAVVTSMAVALSTAQDWFLPVVFVFGASVLPLYAVSLATAADVCDGREFITVGSTVLVLNALGGATAPLALGQLMTHFGATALFWGFAVICAAFAGYLAWQLRTPREISLEEQVPFELAMQDSAPMGFELDPRTHQTETADGEVTVEDTGEDTARP